jgi:hypothetical protein
VLAAIVAVLCAWTSASTAAAQTTVFINEIHYDNTGQDTDEAIEIAGPAGTNLSGWSLVRYNGNNPANGVVYTTPPGPGPLSGVIEDQQNGFGTLTFAYPTDGLQNGPSDGVALVNRHALVNTLEATIATVRRGDAADAIEKLSNDLLPKTTGCLESGAPAKNDWIVTCAAQTALAGRLLEALGDLQQLIP